MSTPEVIYKTDALIAEDIEAYLKQHQHKTLLRFITCGSVDDGKSTLIGRLLYDSKMIFEDQLATLEADSKRIGTQGQNIDFALLVDGLAAEREQGITIDVAYRFFATEKRKFIVADTPGHEQYTRNMVTGASTADLAVILIDARKGVLVQTKRHSYLAHLIGIRNIVLAVNKMDLVGYDQKVFDQIVADYTAFANSIGITDFLAMPISGFKGDNITSASENMPWYQGPALLPHLETVEVDTSAMQDRPFRMAVQWVNRPNLDFRGFSGLISSGIVKPGDAIRVLPSGKTSTVTRIVTLGKDLDRAVAGQSITLTLADEIDCSRGDVIAAAKAPVLAADQFEATIVWMDETEMLPGRPYWLKIGTQTVSATIQAPKYQVSVNTMEHLAAKTLDLNAIGVANLSHRPADSVRTIRRQSQSRRLHPDRQDDERHGGGGHDSLRAAACRERALAGNRHQSRTPRQPQESEAGGTVAHRLVRCGQIDDRQSGRKETGAHEPSHVPARWRQRAAWSQQGSRLHRRGPRGKHPPCRRSGQADDRRWTHRDHRVHLAVPRRARYGAADGARRGILRDSYRHLAGRSGSA